MRHIFTHRWNRFNPYIDPSSIEKLILDTLLLFLNFNSVYLFVRSLLLTAGVLHAHLIQYIQPRNTV